MSSTYSLVYVSLYLNLLTEFIRILDCYIAIVFPMFHQRLLTARNSVTVGAACWIFVISLAALSHLSLGRYGTHMAVTPLL